MKRFFAISMFALVAVSGVAHGTSIDAEALTQYRMEIVRVGPEGSSILLGEGFFRFDQAVVDRLIDEGHTDLGGDFDVVFPVIAAEFEIFGQVFRDDEIRWELFYRGHALDSISVTMRGDCCPQCGPGNDGEPCVEFGAGDDGTLLDYVVNGNRTHCVMSICESTENGVFDEDYRFFFWFEEPVSAPEPGTLALFGLGLLSLGLTRRKVG